MPLQGPHDACHDTPVMPPATPLQQPPPPRHAPVRVRRRESLGLVIIVDATRRPLVLRPGGLTQHNVNALVEQLFTYEHKCFGAACRVVDSSVSRVDIRCPFLRGPNSNLVPLSKTGEEMSASRERERERERERREREERERE